MDASAVDELWAAYRATGDPDAREQLIVEHLSLAKFIAGRIKMKAPAHVEEDELLGWAMLGLIDAVERFEPARELKFTTYASVRIRGTILDHLRSLDWAPRSLRAKARQLEAARQKLLDTLGRMPHEDELAEELDMTRDEVFALESDIHGAYVLSLDMMVGGDEEGGNTPTTLQAVTSDPNTPSPRESARRREVVEQVMAAVQALPDQERHVLVLYYEEELTLKEIGAVLELSESRICQIHRKAMRTLREVAEV